VEIEPPLQENDREKEPSLDDFIENDPDWLQEEILREETMRNEERDYYYEEQRQPREYNEEYREEYREEYYEEHREEEQQPEEEQEEPLNDDEVPEEEQQQPLEDEAQIEEEEQIEEVEEEQPLEDNDNDDEVEDQEPNGIEYVPNLPNKRMVKEIPIEEYDLSDHENDIEVMHNGTEDAIQVQHQKIPNGTKFIL
jgi:hypothetical protein